MDGYGGQNLPSESSSPSFGTNSSFRHSEKERVGEKKAKCGNVSSGNEIVEEFKKKKVFGTTSQHAPPLHFAFRTLQSSRYFTPKSTPVTITFLYIKQQVRELINTQKTSQEHHKKDLKCLQPL